MPSTPHTNTQLNALPGPHLRLCASGCKVHLMQPCTCTSPTGAQYPREQQLIHFAAGWSTSCQLPLSSRTVHACVRGSSCAQRVHRPGRHRSIRGVSSPFPSLLPSARSPCSDPQEGPLSSPFNKSSLLHVVFLACKLPRLICCDRSNLLGKLECAESLPLPVFQKQCKAFTVWIQTECNRERKSL